MSTEWSVSFDWSTTSLPSAGWMSIVHFTIGEDNGKYGDRTPAVFFYVDGDTKLFHFASAVNGQGYTFDETTSFRLNHKYHIEIHQRYISQGNYRYFVKIDGVEVKSVVNSDARQFYEVKVYAGDPWFAPIGYISNLHFTNFL